MKFLCENCKAKYQIADEKVAGRSVRMKCRKCGHLIEIRSSVTETSATLVFSANLLRAGANDAPVSIAPPVTHGVSESPTRASAVGAAAAQPAPSVRPSVPRPGPREVTKQSNLPASVAVQGGLASAFQQAVVAEAKASEPAPSTGAEWFVGIGGSPIGPIGLDELRSRASAGAVQEDSLVWREGFSEWIPLNTVPELRDIARLVRAERSPLSSRAGSLVGRLGIGPRSSPKPSVGGGQVVSLGPRSESGKDGNVPAGGVHETLALSPGAMPLVLPGVAGRSGAASSAQPGTRNPAVPSSSAPDPSASPASPAAPSPAVGAPFGAPGMAAPGMGAPGMGAPGMGAPMGAPMGGPMGMGAPMGGMGAPMGAPMGGPMGAPMGHPGYGMGGQVPAPMPQQMMPYQQQPFGMGMPAAPPGFGMAPPPGFPGAAGPGFTPMGLPPRRKGGIPLAGWFAIAAALGTGVAVGAMWFNREPETKVENENSENANTESAGSTGDGSAGAAEAGGAAGAGTEAAGAAGSEAAGAAGAGDTAGAAGSGSEAAGAAGSGSEAAGAAGAGAEAAGAAGAGAEAAGAAGASADAAGAAGAGDSAAGGSGDSASPVAVAPVAKPGGRRVAGGRPPPKPVAANNPPPVAPVPNIGGGTGPTPAGPTNSRPSGGGGNGLSTDQVQSVVNNGRIAIRRACWEPAIAASGGGANQTRVTVSITIGPDGKVQQATPSGGENFPSLGGCIVGRVRSWIFPSSGGSTQTTATFKFLAQ
jgi:predicted Zn finger-like uncharacterized protein